MFWTKLFLQPLHFDHHTDGEVVYKGQLENAHVMRRVCFFQVLLEMLLIFFFFSSSRLLGVGWIVDVALLVLCVR